ncbi:MAG: SCO family protein [Saprospiraceae bacterium]|nr:SCO family protein [Saprospiraceae bacterium]
MKRTLLSAAALLLSLSLHAYPMPRENDFLNQKIADVKVMTMDGQWTTLSSLFKGKPILISPIYTRCPKACSVITAGLESSIAELGKPGEDFTVVTFSFDHHDQASDLQNFASRWEMDNDNWRIISSDSVGVQTLLGSLDFHYDYDSISGQYEHPNIVIMLSTSGRIMQYIYGMTPKPRDLKLAALNAKREQTTLGVVEGLYLKCFQYNPATKTYMIDWSFLIQLSAGLIMMAFGCAFVLKYFFLPIPKASVNNPAGEGSPSNEDQ